MNNDNFIFRGLIRCIAAILIVVACLSACDDDDNNETQCYLEENGQEIIDNNGDPIPVPCDP